MGGLLNKNGNKIESISKYKELENYLTGEGLDRMINILQNSSDIQFIQMYLRLLPYFKAPKKQGQRTGKGGKTITVQMPTLPNNAIVDIEGNIVDFYEELPSETNEDSKTDNQPIE